MALVVPNGQSRQKSVGLIGPFDISRWLVEEVMSDDRGAEIDVPKSTSHLKNQKRVYVG